MPEFLAIFDVDGTLADSQGVIHQTMCRAFEDAGLAPPDRAAVLSRIGLSLPVLVGELLGEDQSRRDQIVVGYRNAFRAVVEAGNEPLLYPGVEDGLRRLHSAGITLGIATGKSKRGVDRLVASFGWEGLFQTVQCADFHPSKPDPSMVNRALLETATEPVDAVMIGDTSFDMEMARRASVLGLGVDWGYHAPAQLTGAGALRVMSRFEELVEHVEDMAQ